MSVNKQSNFFLSYIVIIMILAKAKNGNRYRNDFRKFKKRGFVIVTKSVLMNLRNRYDDDLGKREEEKIFSRKYIDKKE